MNFELMPILTKLASLKETRILSLIVEFSHLISTAHPSRWDEYFLPPTARLCSTLLQELEIEKGTPASSRAKSSLFKNDLSILSKQFFPLQWNSCGLKCFILDPLILSSYLVYWCSLNEHPFFLFSVFSDVYILPLLPLSFFYFTMFGMIVIAQLTFVVICLHFNLFNSILNKLGVFI